MHFLFVFLNICFNTYSGICKTFSLRLSFSYMHQFTPSQISETVSGSLLFHLLGVALKSGCGSNWVSELKFRKSHPNQHRDWTDLKAACNTSPLFVCLCQMVTTVVIPGAAVVAVWASRVTMAACWGVGTLPMAPHRAPPTAGSTHTTDWWAQLSVTVKPFQKHLYSLFVLLFHWLKCVGTACVKMSWWPHKWGKYPFSV